jgi:hypothetical protein
MDEQQWLSATAPQEMLESLRDWSMLSERKSRLLAVAYCRRIWHLLTDEPCRRAVEVAERFADGMADQTERRAAEEQALAVRGESVHLWERARISAASAAVYAVRFVDPDAWYLNIAGPTADAAAAAVVYATGIADAAERAAQVLLLRDIFGNPFRPLPPVSPSLFAWNGGTVVHLACAAYEERILPEGHLDPARLAVLADALEEAGCLTPEMLAHLRGPGPHVRGCHVLDAILGRD